MKPRVTLITLGVDDLKTGIVEEQFEHGAVVFLDLQAGVKLALWPRESIAHDSGIPCGAHSAMEFTLGHNVNTREEVDAVMGQVAAPGKIRARAYNFAVRGT